MRFTKWQGLGNDFIVIERDQYAGLDPGGLAPRLCDRHFGIGADGVVTLSPEGGNRFEMRIYNADGSECEMCGNATRCVANHIRDRKLAPGSEFELQTRAGVIRPYVLDNRNVRVDMGVPRLRRGEIPMAGPPDESAWNVAIDIGSHCFTGNAVSMGNPHWIVFVPELHAVPLAEWGPMLECHPWFPQKTNVEFVEILGSNLIRLRVWERGCGITMACGTGSCAAVVAGVETGRLARHVGVLLDGGELQIEYSKINRHVHMTGPAVMVYTGDYPVGR